MTAGSQPRRADDIAFSWALGMVARTARKDPQLEAEFERALKKYKKVVCNLIVARKLARIIFWMLTRNEKFRGSSPKAVLTA